MTNQERATQFATQFKAAGISVRRVKVLGGFVHIDTFEKYSDQIQHAMTELGFKPKGYSGGRHLDGVDGYRMVFTA